MPSDTDPAALIAASCDEPVPATVVAAASQLTATFGDSAVAVLGYGSCIRDNEPTDGLLDLYLIVSDYRGAYGRRALRWANRILPPNVFYAKLTLDDATVRVKYAVITIDDFDNGLRAAFLPYFWGRFAQPSRLVWARDGTTRARLIDAFVAAARRSLLAAHPLVTDGVHPESIWTRALALSYATELRPEAPDRAQRLVERDAGHYRRLTAALVSTGQLNWMPLGDGRYRRGSVAPGRWLATRCVWLARRWVGRGAAVLRLAKASFTFRGGVDYAAWKVERHTGTAVVVTPRLRRYPLIFGWAVLWRLLRQRLLR